MEARRELLMPRRQHALEPDVFLQKLPRAIDPVPDSGYSESEGLLLGRAEEYLAKGQPQCRKRTVDKYVGHSSLRRNSESNLRCGLPRKLILSDVPFSCRKPLLAALSRTIAPWRLSKAVVGLLILCPRNLKRYGAGCALSTIYCIRFLVYLLHLIGVAMAGYKTDEQLEELVRAFLKRLGLEHQVRPDLMTIITKIKHLDHSFQYGRVSDAAMPEAEAQWDSSARVLRMRESVFVGMQRNETRARMTVAHELSHYLLKHDGVLNREPGAKTTEMIGAKLRHQESEARRTGPILLAPEHLIPEDATVDDIRHTFGLSPEASTYRIDEVTAIRRRRRGELRPLPRSVADYLREAKRRGHPVRTRLDD